ncbi:MULTISPECIES: type VII toxin-antitoxin system HepT family RNase toxin [Billgrantia]|uniref:DUF86 domain-containing protein n=1 Tax=Billgrantia ethanolica TaxID=2733486 RepID=A0ABS9A0V7_9GAMM|nr:MULTISPECIES: DUF86 domain-containing protein [Halomonas]MCE8002245.1 DUF86 domain-containing protein [Halomonas ethanolica]MCE8013376.1 DUF86 domain-containing protein [Halomonas desiderata]
MADSSPGIAYLVALRQHVAECETDIATLERIVKERPWSRLERHAAERTLQVLIEGCIGVAKHWAKRETGTVSQNALGAFEALIEQGLISHEVPWRKVVGLRNALVHDYLEVDDRIVAEVIEAGHYLPLIAFARQAIQALES